MQAGASMVGGVASTASAAAGSAAATTDTTQRTDGGPMGYFIDSLFRREATAPGAGTAAPSDGARASGQDVAEVGRIFMNVHLSDPLPADDMRYVGQIVAQRTGLPQPEAEKRVADVYAKAQAKVRDAEVAAREAADKARKASAYSALWLFVSLLIGAFVASLAATFGGRQRDA